MEPPIKQKHVDSDSPCSPSSSPSTSSSTTSTPTKIGNQCPHQLNCVPVPLSTPAKVEEAGVHRRTSFHEFVSTYEPSSPTLSHYELLQKFQSHFPMFYSFLGRFHHNKHTPYRVPAGPSYSAVLDCLAENDGIVILCIGLAAEHEAHKVPEFFEGMTVRLINEKRVIEDNLNTNALVYDEIKQDDHELLSIAQELSSSLFDFLPDCFYIVPVLSGPRHITLKVFVLHVNYRYVELQQFPDVWTVGSDTCSVMYFNEFIVPAGNNGKKNLLKAKPQQPRSQVITRSRNKSMLQLFSGSKIMLQRLLLDQSIKHVATVACIVSKGVQQYLITAAHCLPGIPDSQRIDSIDFAIDLLDGNQQNLITSVAPGKVIVRFGNLQCGNSSVYLDVVLIPLPTTVSSYSTSKIALSSQWIEAQAQVVQQSVYSRARAAGVTESFDWFSLKRIDFSGHVSSIVSRKQTSKILFKAGSHTGIRFAHFVHQCPQARVLNLDVSLPLTGNHHCSNGFKDVLTQCNSCVILSSLSDDFSREGDSGSMVFDMVGNVVGIFHSHGVSCCYVCTIEAVKDLFGFSFK
ncbi:hypothetical protein RCL1_001384 [Eukaryota sp. TZLM3-RCL]